MVATTAVEANGASGGPLDSATLARRQRPALTHDGLQRDLQEYIVLPSSNSNSNSNSSDEATSADEIVLLEEPDDNNSNNKNGTNNNDDDDKNITEIPIPTLPPGNRTHPSPAPSIVPSSLPPTNDTTPAPSHDKTPQPTTMAPTTKTPTTFAPSMAPTVTPQEPISFFRMMGKMIAWIILMGLCVLAYGFCINHRYQIAYYGRHCFYCLYGVNQWLLQKIRPDASHNLHSGYAAMYASERNDAQSLLFDAPNGQVFEHDDDGLFGMGGGGNSGAYGFPQHSQGYYGNSNMPFQPMG